MTALCITIQAMPVHTHPKQMQCNYCTFVTVLLDPISFNTNSIYTHTICKIDVIVNFANRSEGFLHQ